MLKVENIQLIQFAIMISLKSILIMSIFFECVSTVIKSDNNLFKVNDNSFGNTIDNKLSHQKEWI